MNTLTDFLPASDDLSDALSAKTNIDPVRAAKIAAAEAAKVGFVETCPKCRGTGRYNSHSQYGYQCFACKGKGKKTFKQPAAKRADNRLKAADRAAAKAQAAVEAFNAAHPDVAAWMNGSTFPFAVSLAQAVAKYGSLTENQINAARRCIASKAQAQEAAVSRVQAAPVIDLTKLEAAFAKAAENGLKKVKVRFAGLTVSPAKATSANAGGLYVKADGEYVGKIMSGRFLCTRECSDDVKERVLSACADPKAAAVAYGKQTGSCSCCGRKLTDPVSIENGIGPICADNYGW